MKEYYTLYRRAVSGPDVVVAFNITPALANYFKRYWPDQYRIEKQAERIY